MKRRWTKSRKALVIALTAFAVSCVLYLWLPYRVAVVQLFFKLGGSRAMIPVEYRPLDAPRYVPVAQASGYAAGIEVLGLELNGEAKAIPVKRIAWHLVVNDQFGGQPVVITLCTVANAALAYRASAGEQSLRFAPARLARNNLVMRDLQTGSCWQQFTGRATEGPLAGTELTPLPMLRMSLQNWRERHPAGLILEPAGSDRDCCAPNDTCPVMSYFSSRPFLLQAPSHEDERWPRKQPVTGLVSAHGDAVAVAGELPADFRCASGCFPIPCYWFAWAEFHPETKLAASWQAVEAAGFGPDEASGGRQR
jgi:hypothetical protein